MRVSVRLVAAAILANVTSDETAIANLAACLSHGTGAFRLPRTPSILLVLDYVLRAREELIFPLIVWTRFTKPSPGTLSTTERVAHNFREFNRQEIGDRHSGTYPPGYKPEWVPIPQDVTGWIPFGGPETKPVAQTFGAVTPELDINWVDLRSLQDFPVGCLVWRLTESAKGVPVLVGYQRLQNNLWLPIQVQRPACSFNLRDILDQLKVNYAPQPVDYPLPTLSEQSR